MMTRTTVRLPQALLEELKRRAFVKKRSLAKEMEEALYLGLKAQTRPKDKIELPVFRGGTGPAPGVDITDTSALLELTESNE